MMIKATDAFLKDVEECTEIHKREILNAKDLLTVKGTAYYVSNDGDDNNDGKSPVSAWKSLAKVTETELCEGDGVFFRRGDLFRGFINAQAGVTYAAYGEGEKPKLYGWDRSLAFKISRL